MRIANVIFVLAGTLLMAFIMGDLGAPLKGPGTPLGIIDLELAFNSERATAILQNWTYTYAGGITRSAIAISHTWLDFVFIFFYSFFLFFGNKSISETFSGWAASLGKIAAMLSLYAGLFDIVENLGLLAMLKGYTGNFIPEITGAFSFIKWILILYSIFYIITFGAISVFRRKKKK